MLIFEALTCFRLTVHEPSEVTVTHVYITDVSGLRSVHLVTIFYDHVWVYVASQTWINKSSRLVCALSVDVTNYEKRSVSSCYVCVCNSAVVQLYQNGVRR